MKKLRRFFAYRSFWPELETVHRFGEIGIDTVAVFPSNTRNSLGEPYSKYPPNWLWFDAYDFGPVKRQFTVPSIPGIGMANGFDYRLQNAGGETCRKPTIPDKRL